MRPPPLLMPLLAALLTSAAVLAGVFELDRLERDRLAQRNRAETLDHLSLVRSRLESAINARLFLNRGLMAYVSSHPRIAAQEFHVFADGLTRQQRGIRSIQLAKDSIVSHIHPMEGNRAALGLKLLQQPKQRDAVARAIESGDTVVAGPVELVQGGTAFVSRTPIFLARSDGAPGRGAYWGLATIILDKDALFEEAGLSRESARFDFALRGTDGAGPDGAVFWGNPALFETDSVRLDVSVPNGSWQLAALPRNEREMPGSPWLRPDGMLLALAVGILTWFLVRNPARLRQMVQQTTRALQEVDRRTAELRIANERLKAEISEREYAEKTLRAQRDLYYALIKAQSDIGESVLIVENGRIIFANDASCRQFGYAREEIKALPSFIHLVHPDDRERILENHRRRLAGEQLESRHEISILTRDGQRREAEIAVAAIHKDNALRTVVVAQDITERKRMGDALHSQLLFTRALFEAIPSPVFFKNKKGEYLGCNQAFEAAFGLSRQDIGGKTVYDVMPRELADIYYAMDNALFQAPGRQVYESQVGLADGTRREVIFNKATFADASGELSGLVGVILDITERKQMEDALRRAHDELEARVRERTRELARINDELNVEIAYRKQAEEGLRESEARFRATFDASSDCIVVVDREYTCLYANQAAVRRTAQEQEKIVGHSLLRVLADAFPGADSAGRANPAPPAPEGIAAHWKRGIDGVFATGETQHLENCAQLDGKPIYSETAMFPIRDADGSLFAVGIFDHDVTERKRAENILRRQAQIINQIHDSVIATDIDGTITFWNDGAKQMFGYSSEEATGRHISLLYPRPKYRSIRQKVVAHLRAREVYEAEVLRRKKSGELIHIHLILSLLQDRDGETIGLVGYSMDIDKRKHLEQQIIEVSEEEQKRIGQELHDGLGQHLTGIAFLSKVLEQKLAARSLPETADAAEIVKFVNQAVSKTRALARGLFPVELEANGLMSALEQLAANAGKLFGIPCVFRCESPVLVHDRIAAINLYRIAQEAINNAAKHSKASRIRIALAVADGKISLSVTDDGIGFHPKPRGEHEGMGFHIMRHRAGMLGASLSIQKAAGSGTEVLVTLER